MPKTAVYKKNRFEFWQNNIGFPWKIDPLQTKAISQTVQQGLNGLSRASIAAFDLSHRPAAFFRAQLVHAETISALESKAKSTAGDASEALCGPRWPKPAGQSAPAYPELSAVVGPQVPDLRGLFLRGYGSQSHVQNNGAIIGVTSTLHSSGALGQVQGDGNRRFTGTIGPSINAGSGGIVYGGGNAGYMVMGAAHFVTAYHYIDSARVLPTAPENRPVNQAVRYLVRARP